LHGTLPFHRLTPADSTVDVFLHGAHVARFDPKTGHPLLFMSSKSLFEADKPIRGGVPVIFPWFGKSTLGQHGLVRTMPWTVKEYHCDPAGSSEITLALASDARTLAVWPHAFDLTFRVKASASLSMELTVHNPGREPFTFEEALHTYFAVSDVRQISIDGLQKTPYIDKVGGTRDMPGTPDPIRITAETDRVYLNTPAACTVRDPGWQRSIRIAKTGSQSTVVWNPWIDKAKAMPDFGDDEWPNMVCVESANVGPNAIKLDPDQKRTLGVEIISQSLRPA
jgi:glucose-6-phosphate 1-epimerase